MIKTELIKIVGKIKSEFPGNKLAYLAMTSKVEDQVRDAIANQMHIELQKINSTSFVCREWKKIDAEILDSSGNPELLIECKAHNSINFPFFLLKRNKKPTDSYPIVHDIKKLLDNGKDESSNYFIFFNNIVKSQSVLPKNFKGQANNPIAYQALVNKLIGLPYIDKLERVLKNWAFLLEQLKLPLDLTSAVELNAGDYFNNTISILAFIYGPITNNVISSSLISTLPGNNQMDFINPKFDQFKFANINLNGIYFYSKDAVLLNLIKKNMSDIKCYKILN